MATSAPGAHATPTMLSELAPVQKVGDAVWEIAQRSATIMNSSEFATSLRKGALSRERFVGFITAMYPCVVGFNRALLRGVCKVDHVRRSKFVKALAEQIREEQDHNDLWRLMLDRYGVDHRIVYSTLRGYQDHFSEDELDSMTLATIEALTHDIDDLAPGCFADAPFPEPVLALYHHLWMLASSPAVHHWEQFASQSAMEHIIYEVVSTSVFPGITATPALHAEPDAARWWTEHARQGSDSGRKTTEEKHLEMARLALNRGDLGVDLEQRIIEQVEKTTRLFAATLLCHNKKQPRFSVTPFLKG